MRSVSPGYFKTLRVPFIGGKLFDDSDMNKEEVIVNQTFARRFFQGRDPIGKNLLMNVLSPKPTAFRILGVVADVKDAGLGSQTKPTLYYPGFFAWATVMVRTKSDPTRVSGMLRHDVANIDKNQPIDEIRTLDDIISSSVARQRLSAELLGLFSLAALALAAIGIYGVTAYLVTQSTREIGIRMALGAGRANILGLIIGSNMRLVLVGLFAGLAGALAIGRAMSSLLYQVRPADPVTLSLVLLTLAAVAALAVLIPARRASRMDPVQALRFE